MKNTLALSLLCAAAAAAHADDAISPDRPSATNGPDVVGTGVVQIETGPAGTKDNSARAIGLPWVLRVGLTSAVELRVDSGGYQRVRQGGTSVSGWNDIGLGAKWKLREGDGAMPSIGLLGHLSFATGSGAFRGQGTRPEIDIPLSWDLSNGLSLGVMPGVYQDRNDAGQHYTGSVLTICLTQNLPGDWSVFGEVAGQRLAAERNGGRVVTVDAGVSRLLTKDVMIDAAVFRGVSHQAPDWQWTVGVSARF
ncbi:transporter [Burkholderiaceae bacterium UC74_6]